MRRRDNVMAGPEASIGMLARARRADMRISVNELAGRANVAEKTIVRLESGTQNVRPALVADVLRALNLPPGTVEKVPGGQVVATMMRQAAEVEARLAEDGDPVLRDRIAALAASPPSGYVFSSWRTRDGVFHIEYRPLSGDDARSAASGVRAVDSMEDDHNERVRHLR